MFTLEISQDLTLQTMVMEVTLGGADENIWFVRQTESSDSEYSAWISAESTAAEV